MQCAVALQQLAPRCVETQVAMAGLEPRRLYASEDKAAGLAVRYKRSIMLLNGCSCHLGLLG